MSEAEKYIRELKLQPHPEGGYYNEIYRSEEIFETENSGRRNLCTSIYFLLEGDQVSTFHQLKSDEIWFFHQGTPLKVYLIQNNNFSFKILGPEVTAGQHLQIVIPAGTIFGAELINKNSFCLFGCVVNPGFNFKDFRLISRKKLINNFPEHDTIIKNLTFK